MAQFLRPDSNITQTNFVGGFAEIDEVTANDADYAYSEDRLASVLEVGLSDPAATPGAGTCTVRYRIAKVDGGVFPGTGGSNPTATMEVYQGATQISAGPAAIVPPDAWTAQSFTFDASLVTDWTDVRLRFSVSSTGGSPANGRGGAVSWAEIETPAGVQAVDFDGASYTLTGSDLSTLGEYAQSIQQGDYQAVFGDIQSLKSYSLFVDSALIDVDGNQVETLLLAEQEINQADYVINVSAVVSTAAQNQEVDGAAYQIDGGDIDSQYNPVSSFSQDVNSAEYLLSTGDVDTLKALGQDVNSAEYLLSAGDVDTLRSLGQGVDGSSYQTTFEDVDLQYTPTTAVSVDVDGSSYQVTFNQVVSSASFVQAVASTNIAVTEGQVQSIFVPKPADTQDFGSGSFTVQAGAVALNVIRAYSQNIASMDLIVSARRPWIIYVTNPPLGQLFIGRPRTFSKPLLGQATGQGRPFF